MSSAHSAATPSPRGALSGVRSLVVKLGTQLLSRPDRTLDTQFLADIARQIVAVRCEGVRVTVVSSGAVGAGLAALRLSKRPDDLSTLQAVAAVGQPQLIAAWSQALSPHGLAAAQILLTREDIDDRTRFLNLRNTLAAAHQLGAIPIINENDTISTDEMIRISFGDNDLLAAAVTQAIRAEVLVLLTVVDGVLDGAGKPVRLVDSVAAVQALVRSEKSSAGKGGMDSKLRAAREVTGAGERLIVADGRMRDILPRLLRGEELGTLFVPSRGRSRGRSRWITSARPSGSLLIDAGAARALSRGDRSLLPAGVTAVKGSFQRGDVVEILSPEGESIARGLSNYPSAQIELIRGKRTPEVRRLLSDATYDEVVHRDNLVLLSVKSQD